jgi:hypothetical protein
MICNFDSSLAKITRKKNIKGVEWDDLIKKFPQLLAVPKQAFNRCLDCMSTAKV